MGSEQSHESHSNRQRGMPAYSRHTGKNMGSHTHYRGEKIGHPSSNLIGRTRMTRQYSQNVRIRVKEITSPVLGSELIKRCGNEGQHSHLDEQGKATLKFLRAAISFIPEVIDAGGDLSNTSFIFAQPGREFVPIAGNGDWEFYFSQGSDDGIYGRCVRKPTVRFATSGITFLQLFAALVHFSCQ
ncbi:uncharacterized protein LOC144664251 [Oculina patagonica]